MFNCLIYITVEVDAENGTISQINIFHKMKEECVSDIKVNESSYKKYSNQIYNMLSAMGENDIIEEMRFVYKYRKDNTLNRGNIKYLVKLKDGSAYVFLYSVNTKMVYNFYKMYDYADVLMQENRNKKLQKQSGILTKTKVIMK